MIDLSRGLLKGFYLAEWFVLAEDGSLRSPDRVYRIEPLLMQLLVFLCSRARQVVTKQDLLDIVWCRLVSDETIKASIHQLRRALGDDPRRPRFIETLPKRGYRLMVNPVLAMSASRSTDAVSAQYLVERGRAALGGQPNRASLKQAELYFEQAVRVSPENAEALAELGRTYVLMSSMGVGTGSALLPLARRLAIRAIELDPKLAESRLPLAVAHFVLDHDFESAERQFREGIRLNSKDSLTHRWYARFLSFQNRHEEAVTEARRALEVDPLMLAARRELPKILAVAGRYDEALKETHRLAEIVPDMPELHFGLTLFYHLIKLEREVFTSFVAYLQSLNVAPPVLAEADRAFALGGVHGLFSFWVGVLENEAKPGPRNQWHLIILYALVGNKDRCFEIMEAAFIERSPSLLWLAASPLFEKLRPDARYSDFLTRLGLKEPNTKQQSAVREVSSSRYTILQ